MDCQSNAKASEKDHDLPRIRTQDLWISSQHCLSLHHRHLGRRPFLTNQKFYVTVAGERSAEYGVPSGVPQGAVLSPTLFTIYLLLILTLSVVQLALLPKTRHYLVHMPKQM
jgi:hypothetical protein